MNLLGKFSNLGSIGDAIGDLVDGLSKSGVVSPDNSKISIVQEEIVDLQKQETEIFAEIGRQAFAANPSSYSGSAHGEKLRLVRMDIAAAEARLSALHEEEAKARQSQGNVNAGACCPVCGHKNGEGMKFCQKCGGKLGKVFCLACGTELAPGVRFCGACGVKQAE